MSTRRLFLKLGTITGAAALVPVRSGAAPAGGSGLTSGGTRGLFLAELQQPFVVEGAAPLRLVLDAVSDLGVPGLAGHPECFSASFLGPANAPLRQGTHRLANRGRGRMDVFLVPVGRPRDGRQAYEAVFNSPVPA
ncbi:MAG TPA: hypothetical protein VGB87_22565 [Vicinamibacteria bacterium]